ncbi:MAG: hypothetical protein AVDCRST_MAG67-4458, partial [uncultured Solirubrobacteraceae bacterium]
EPPARSLPPTPARNARRAGASRSPGGGVDRMPAAARRALLHRHGGAGPQRRPARQRAHPRGAHPRAPRHAPAADRPHRRPRPGRRGLRADVRLPAADRGPRPRRLRPARHRRLGPAALPGPREPPAVELLQAGGRLRAEPRGAALLLHERRLGGGPRGAARAARRAADRAVCRLVRNARRDRVRAAPPRPRRAHDPRLAGGARRTRSARARDDRGRAARAAQRLPWRRLRRRGAAACRRRRRAA